MAKSDNFFNIRGRMGDLIFCIRDGKTYVKRYSGGFTKKEIQNNPNVKASQERFAQVSRYVKSFKQGLLPYLWRQKDGSFHNQLMAHFSQMSKSNPEKSFEEILREKANYQSLKNKSLNKNSKINPYSLSYDPISNTLSLGNLLYELSGKYPGMFLEVAMGWYGVSQKQACLSVPVLQYIKLDAKHLHQKVTIEFALPDSDKVFLPFVGLTVVNRDSPESSSLHPMHTLTACFL